MFCQVLCTCVVVTESKCLDNVTSEGLAILERLGEVPENYKFQALANLFALRVETLSHRAQLDQRQDLIHGRLDTKLKRGSSFSLRS